MPVVKSHVRGFVARVLAVVVLPAPALAGEIVPPMGSILTRAAGADDPAGGGDESLAKKLSNPVASLISVPLQGNVDFGAGPKDGQRYTLNVQPVIPIPLDDEWNLISRTIVPIVYQNDVAVDGGDSQFGLGDTVASGFFSPKAPGPGGLIWGAGPVVLLPTGTNDSLGGEQWGLGPTGVALWQSGPWTYGVLANHLWSVAGESDRAAVNATFVQPFISYTTPGAFTLSVNTEATYDWNASRRSIPINVVGSQLLRLGTQPVSVGLGARYYVARQGDGPTWGLRLVVTFLFPR